MFRAYVKPEEVWDYFQKHKVRLKNELDVIAEFETDEGDTPLKVYLTEEQELPLLTVEYDDGEVEEVVEKEGAVSPADCKSVADRFYAMVKDSATEAKDEDTDFHTLDDCDFEIVAEREYEIIKALKEFLKILMGCDSNEEVEFDDETLLEMLPYIEETIFECGFVPYHPQIFEDENGVQRLITSPYDEEMI